MAFAQVGMHRGQRACGLGPDGSLWCWGTETTCLYGFPLKTLQPTRVGVDRYKSMSIDGFEKTCAVRDDGSLWCWGAGHYSPARQDGASDWEQVASDTIQLSGYSLVEQSCKLDTSGSLWCWLATDEYDTKSKGEPIMFGEAGEWAAVSMRGHYRTIQACALKKDRSLWCWLLDAERVARTGVAAQLPEPKKVEGDNWSDFVVAETYWSGLREDGSSWLKQSYSLGCGGTITAPLTALSGKWAHLVRSADDPCALDSAGAVSCWHLHWDGNTHKKRCVERFKDGAWDKRKGAGQGWAALTIDGALGGLKRDGSLWTSPLSLKGYNCPVTAKSTAPSPWGKESDWAQVVVGDKHACALKKGGELWCWGSNEDGGVGIGPPEHQRKPIRIPLGKN